MTDRFFELRRLADELPRHLGAEKESLVKLVGVYGEKPWLRVKVPDRGDYKSPGVLDQRAELALRIVAEVGRLRDEGIL